MSEVKTIKAEIELIPVWVRAISGKYVERWATEEMAKDNVHFMCLDHTYVDVKFIMMQKVNAGEKVYTKDPFVPKTPEWMPDGCELWKAGTEGESIVYRNKLGQTAYHPDTFTRFHSFAIQAGNGVVSLEKTANFFTIPDSSALWSHYNEGDVNAVCLGAVMKKEVGE